MITILIEIANHKGGFRQLLWLVAIIVKLLSKQLFYKKGPWLVNLKFTYPQDSSHDHKYD